MTVIPNHTRLIKAARVAGIPVIYASIGGFRADYGDLGPNVRQISIWPPRGGTHACAIIDELRTEPDDIFLIKMG